MTDQTHLTLPANLREAADDLPRLSSSEEHWRFRNLYTWAADRIDTLQADAEQGPRAAVETVLRAIDNFEDHRRGAAGYTGPLAERVVATCRELERRVLAGWEPQRALADYLIAEFGPGMVDPAVVLPEAGVDIGAPAEVALRALKHAKARGAFRVAGETFPLASNLRAAATANPALADLLSLAADAIEVAMQHADEAEAITMAKTVEFAKMIESLDVSLVQEQNGNAQDRFEMTEEIKRLTALSQSLRAAGEHSEVKFMAAVERASALEALLAEIETTANVTQMSKVQFRGRVRELARQRLTVPEGIDQREADIALSKEVEQQALTQLVVEAGALMFCGERDPVTIAGKALLGLFRSLDREDLLDDIDDALPGLIVGLEERIDPEDIDGDDGA